MIIFYSFLATFEARVIIAVGKFRKLACVSNQTTTTKLNLSKFVKCSVYVLNE